MSDHMSEYKRLTIDLIQKRKLGNMSDDEESSYIGLLDKEWECMTQEQWIEIDAWVRLLVQ